MEEQNQNITAISSVEKSIIEAQVVEVLQTCYDPEIPVNIHELGLIYSVTVDDMGGVEVKMTLTSPHCPAAQSLPPEVASKVKTVKGVTSAKVTVVWEPPWNPSMMSEAAKLTLGF
jgi:FeS assembly SUF system protein